MKKLGSSKLIFNGDYAIQTRIDGVIELYRFAGLAWDFLGMFYSKTEAEKAAEKDWNSPIKLVEPLTE